MAQIAEQLRVVISVNFVNFRTFVWKWKFGLSIVFDKKATRKKFQADWSTPSAFFEYLRACMAFMPNSWPVSMKFGMSVVFDGKTTRTKFELDRVTSSAIFVFL